MQRMIRYLLIFFSFGMFSTMVDAAFVAHNTELGVGSTIRDTETNLDWLRLDLSNLSDQDRSELNDGGLGTWSGYRYATGAELQNLMVTSGILPHYACANITCNINSFADSVLAQTIADFIGVFGFSSSASNAATGDILDAAGRYDSGNGLSAFTAGYGGNSATVGNGNGCYYYMDCAAVVSPYEGNWIVRVPEPPMLLVFLSALLMMFARRTVRD